MSGSSCEINHHGNQAVHDNSFTSPPSFQNEPGISYEHETSFEGPRVAVVDGSSEGGQLGRGVAGIIGDFSLEEIPTFETVSQNKATGNTQHLYTVRLRKPCTSQCCACCPGEDPELCEVPTPLQSRGVTKDVYREAMKHILSSTKIRQYTLWYNRFLQTLLFSILFLSLWGVSLLLWWRHGLHLELGVTLFAVSSVAVILFCYVSCSCFRRRLNYSSKCALSKCNAVLLKNHVICTTMEEGAVGCYVVYLHFAFYNPGPCLDRLIQVLNCALVRKVKRRKKSWCARIMSLLCSFPCLRSTPSAGTHIKHPVIEETDFMLCDDNISQTRIQEFAAMLLHHYSHRYLSSLIVNSVRKPFYSRHVPEKLCLCQYIEREFFHLPLDSINTIAV